MGYGVGGGMARTRRGETGDRKDGGGPGESNGEEGRGGEGSSSGRGTGETYIIYEAASLQLLRASLSSSIPEEGEGQLLKLFFPRVIGCSLKVRICL